ncbi:ribokinase [Synechococcus sp. A18-25c]|uniref:PfkB family carbohydrate kinase n=1 Tax=Synechococcus sp. A18-25c TaxID=1866938 RepID=UPI0016481FDC|nr:PfkB family carbohydrate kinase [Synechococcus sp. A18-25c]QNJ19593.1 ribokinase [Synechococcus sp. A18-25c]
MTPTPSVVDLQSLRLAVVGHQEWVTFLEVDALPQPGCISRASRSLEEPAGAGAVVAVQLARLTGRPVLFFTALGRDAIGERSVQRLKELGVEPVVAWRDGPSRRGISMMDPGGDRAITVIGDRLTPMAHDALGWDQLADCDGVFVSATDADGLRLARQAKVLTATPRLRLPVLQEASLPLDALIGSGLDPGEQLPPGSLEPTPTVQIATEGDAGGLLIPGGRFSAEPLPAPMVESYGCGDSFAAGVTAGLAAGWSVNDAVALGARCGAACATRFGPYG